MFCLTYYRVLYSSFKVKISLLHPAFIPGHGCRQAHSLLGRVCPKPSCFVASRVEGRVEGREVDLSFTLQMQQCLTFCWSLLVPLGFCPANSEVVLNSLSLSSWTRYLFKSPQATISTISFHLVPRIPTLLTRYERRMQYLSRDPPLSCPNGLLQQVRVTHDYLVPLNQDWDQGEARKALTLRAKVKGMPKNTAIKINSSESLKEININVKNMMGKISKFLMKTGLMQEILT